LNLPDIRALDMWGNSIAMEAPDGSVVIGTYDGTKPMQILNRQMMPLSPLGNTRIIELSPDGRFLAVSGRSRGAIWDLQSGERLYHVLGFTGDAFHSDGNLYLDFPKLDKTDRHVARFNLYKNEITKVEYPLDDSMLMRAGRMMEWKDQGKGKLLLTVRDPATGKEQWNRTFEKEKPASTRNYADNNLLFVWRTSSAGGKEELKNKPALASQVAALKDKDAGLLIEIVSIDNGEILRSAVLTRPSAYSGVNGLDQVQDTILMTTSDNRVLLFSARTGAITHQVFGYVVGVDRQAGLFCVKNRLDEVFVYDLDGKEVSHFQAGTTVRFARFENNGKKLLLLGSDQKIREIDLHQKTVVTRASSNTSSGELLP
jgi:WD40 repeat protein